MSRSRASFGLRLVRLASRLAVWALGLLVLVVIFGIAGWKGWTALAFVVSVTLALVAGLAVIVAALLSARDRR